MGPAVRPADETRDLVAEIQDRSGVPAAAHLTCVDATRAEIDAIADAYWQAGINRIIALRGDPAAGHCRWLYADAGWLCICRPSG